LDFDSTEQAIEAIESFNPSVGILLVWTSGYDGARGRAYMFQSLGRDSVGLDTRVVTQQGLQEMFQSLGRDSVGLDLIISAP